MARRTQRARAQPPSSPHPHSLDCPWQLQESQLKEGAASENTPRELEELKARREVRSAPLPLGVFGTAHPRLWQPCCACKQALNREICEHNQKLSAKDGECGRCAHLPLDTLDICPSTTPLPSAALVYPRAPPPVPPSRTPTRPTGVANSAVVASFIDLIRHPSHRPRARQDRDDLAAAAREVAAALRVRPECPGPHPWKRDAYPCFPTRGHEVNCIRPYSAVSTVFVARVYSRGALCTLHNTVLPP